MNFVTYDYNEQGAGSVHVSEGATLIIYQTPPKREDGLTHLKIQGPAGHVDIWVEDNQVEPTLNLLFGFQS